MRYLRAHAGRKTDRQHADDDRPAMARRRWTAPSSRTAARTRSGKSWQRCGTIGQARPERSAGGGSLYPDAARSPSAGSSHTLPTRRPTRPARTMRARHEHTPRSHPLVPPGAIEPPVRRHDRDLRGRRHPASRAGGAWVSATTGSDGRRRRPPSRPARRAELDRPTTPGLRGRGATCFRRAVHGRGGTSSRGRLEGEKNVAGYDLTSSWWPGRVFGESS